MTCKSAETYNDRAIPTKINFKNKLKADTIIIHTSAFYNRIQYIAESQGFVISLVSCVALTEFLTIDPPRFLPVFLEAIISHLRQQQTYSILVLLVPSFPAAEASATSSAILPSFLGDVIARRLQLCHLTASAPIILVVNGTLTFTYGIHLAIDNVICLPPARNISR